MNKQKAINGKKLVAFALCKYTLWLVCKISHKTTSFTDSGITFGDVTIDFSGYTASDSAGKIDITPKEIDLLRLLVEHKGLVLTRSQILDELWTPTS